MDLSLYLAFVAASVVLIMIPGPNVALIVAEAARHGARAGFAVVFGTTAAQAVQLTLVAAGFAALVAVYADAFAVVRVVGAVYLVWLGVAAVRASLKPDAEGPPPAASRSFRRGALVALANPKTLVFHAAFLPQFVDPAHAVAPQLALLGATFLGLALVLDTGWMLLGARAGGVLRRPGVRAWLDRAVGGVLITGGLALALKRS
jgi:threonine/homoserine/homoserine lactone efflux protein